MTGYHWDRRCGSAAAVMMAAVLLFVSSVSADSGGGSSTTQDDGSSEMTYITIGLAVLVAGFLAYDAITDSGDDEVTAHPGDTGIIDTGVDWDRAMPSDADGETTLAVSVLPGPEGQQRALQLIGALREMLQGSMNVYDDPVDLGSGSEIQRAALAREFFGIDYLVFQVAGTDSMLMFGVATADSVVWTSPDQSGNSMLVVAAELVQSGAF